MHPPDFTKPNLIYTVAFDPPGWRGGRTMAKLLCSSLLRQFWSGEIVVFRNSPQPLFPVERKGLEEVFVETPEVGQGKGAGQRCLKAALEYRFRAAEMLDPSRYEWMAYVDADCLALRNLDHLFTGGADILVQPEAGRHDRGTGQLSHSLLAMTEGRASYRMTEGRASYRRIHAVIL